MHLLRIYKYIDQSFERKTSIGGSMATSPGVKPVNGIGGSIGASGKGKQLWNLVLLNIIIITIIIY